MPLGLGIYCLLEERLKRLACAERLTDVDLSIQ